MIEVRADRMPDGGLVTTFTDITPSVKAAEALERANATLERRVRERTGELTRLNAELERAKAEADDANVSKTRFVAAASHDILQPLNAARLYVTSLIERQRARRGTADLVQNIDASLEAVEEIFAALLDISRLDTGAMKPEFADFRIDELLQRLEVEFAPLAREKGLALTFMPCSLAVRSDRRLLRRLLQNLVSNAIKYTPEGRVLVGCRRRGARLRIEVYDTGIGIPHAKRRAVFKEFHRLDQGARVARGVGLGPVDRRAHRARARLRGGAEIECRPRLAIFASKCRAAAVASPRRRCARRPESRRRAARRHGRALHRQRAAPSSTAWRRCSAAGAAACSSAADLAEALAAIEASGARARRTSGRLSPRRRQRRRRHRRIAPPPRPRRSPPSSSPPTARLHVREAARAAGAHLLNKPLKPASLRALITQWRVQRVAAE